MPSHDTLREVIWAVDPELAVVDDFARKELVLVADPSIGGHR